MYAGRTKRSANDVFDNHVKKLNKPSKSTDTRYECNTFMQCNVFAEVSVLNLYQDNGYPILRVFVTFLSPPGKGRSIVFN